VWGQLQAFLKLRRVPLPPAVPRANSSDAVAVAVEARVRRWLRQQLLPTYALMERFYGMGW
jgi:hypothetical protein